MKIAPVTNPAPFQADWPKQEGTPFQKTLAKIKVFTWNLFSAIVFPVGLARLANMWIRDRVLKIIIPGQMEFPECDSLSQFALCVLKFLWNPDRYNTDTSFWKGTTLEQLNGELASIKTPDGAKLDGIFIPGKIQGKVILYGGGNMMQWETSQGALEEMRGYGPSILMINPRGTGESRGWRSEEGYALDYYTAYEWLIHEKQIDPENILLVGFSMGAANGTLGAQKIQEKYPDKKISAINIRSFSDLHKECSEIIGWRGPISWAIQIALKILRLNAPVKKGWDSLKGRKCLFYHSEDPIIPKAASLYKAVKADPKGETRAVKMDKKAYPECNAHVRPYTSVEKNQLHHQIYEMLSISHKIPDGIPLAPVQVFKKG